MKRLSFATLLTLILFSCTSQQKEFKYSGNPLVRHVYTADPTARVFGDRLYVYTSHDRDDAEYFDMEDWHVFSTDDLENWVDHGAFFSLDDIEWADSMAWAPDCYQRNGKYYFYYPVGRKQIGVAESNFPTKGFKDSGAPLIDNTGQVELIGREPIDPTIIVDNDQAYIYFGCRDFRWAKLKDNMMELDGPILEMQIIGNEEDREHFGGYYGEGPFIFKREGIFYMVYSNGWGHKSTLVYATADNPEGPFTYKGAVMAPVSSFTSHGSIVEFKGQWYVFYHNKELSGFEYRRSVAFDKIDFAPDGSIIKAKQTFGNDL